MSLTNQFLLFAEYNKLMNQRIMAAAGRLSTEDLMQDRGAFFKSVMGTLNHILVGDIIWLKRFSSIPAFRETLDYLTQIPDPASLDTILFDELADLGEERTRIDEIMINWVTSLSAGDIDDYLEYRNMAGKSQKKPVSSLISHLFLHQTHHRGQVTTLISQSGIDFGDTDILEIIDDYPA